MNEFIEKSSNYLNETILRYPYNGRSKYLIDKFYIMGFDSKTLYKNLIENNNNDDSNNKSNISANTSFEELLASISAKSDVKKTPQIFQIDDPPTILNEITSDYKKQVPDKDLIKDMIFPNKIDFYFTEELIKMKTFYSAENNIKINNRQNFSLHSFNNNNTNYNNNDNFTSIYVEDENNNYNNKYIKPYNVIFSYNPQTENSSKKSINGFAHIFYRKYYKYKSIGDKYIYFFVPIIFCIISEYPFYNSFYLLCNQIKNLYKEKNIEVPLEILIYNIINFTLSPLNNDIYLFIEPINFPTKKIELKNFKENNNKKLNFNGIEEVEEENNLYYIDKNEDNSIDDIIEEDIEEEKKVSKKVNLTKKINKKYNFYKTRNRGNTNYKNFNRDKINLLLNNYSNDKSKIKKKIILVEMYHQINLQINPPINLLMLRV